MKFWYHRSLSFDIIIFPKFYNKSQKNKFKILQLFLFSEKLSFIFISAHFKIPLFSKSNFYEINIKNKSHFLPTYLEKKNLYSLISKKKKVATGIKNVADSVN